MDYQCILDLAKEVESHGINPTSVRLTLPLELYNSLLMKLQQEHAMIPDDNIRFDVINLRVGGICIERKIQY